jgi:glycosyltransferase involved in cell wall biosynthesis
MSLLPSKLRFHLGLYAAFSGLRRGKFSEISTAAIEPDEIAPKKLKVFFWTPVLTPGANVIVHDMLPCLTRLARATAPGWEIRAGAELPPDEVDWLVCFKAVPPPEKIRGKPRLALLICDQAELFWDSLRGFDEIVATSSRAFAGLLGLKHPRVTFIPESEPPEYISFGVGNLCVAPAARGDVLLWHGGNYSQDALNDLRPALGKFAEQTCAQLHVISGKDGPRVENWGALAVNFFPWSKEQLLRSAAQARLGFVPARCSVKLSWLKPASRVRCLFALGVPAIGDDRVPDTVEFMAGFDGPLAGRRRAWLDALTGLWNDAPALARLAASGHAKVAEEFSTGRTARQWLRYIAQNNQS